DRACARRNVPARHAAPASVGSWVEQPAGPGLAVAAPAHAFVQAELGAVPELQHVRLNQVATPVRRPRHLAPLELLLVARHALLEGVVIGQRLRLQRGPGADLAAALAAGEIG